MLPTAHEPGTAPGYPPGPASANRPTVVYIAGRGHSGSTLLDLLISSHADVVSVGEAKQFRTRPDKRCTCGAPSFTACPFWSAVDEELGRAGMRLGVKAIGEGPPEEIARYNEAFFRAVARVSGCSVIVDSSKACERLEHLLTTQLDVRVIHLVREATGVVYSNLEKGRDLREACRLLVREAVHMKRVLSARPHVPVRYEELARHPAAELERIMGALGLVFDPEQLSSFKTGARHNYGGNVMRRQVEDHTIRLDERWRTGLTQLQKLEIRMRTWPARVTNPHLLRWLDRA